MQKGENAPRPRADDGSSPLGSPSVTAIIPVYHDHSALAATLPYIIRDARPESILVVGVAGDEEAEAVARAGACTWASSPVPGRATQMNLGASLATGETFFFLHADTRPPLDAAARIRHAIDTGAVGGAFARRFDSSSPVLRLTCRLADWRGRRFGWFLGDQGIFARADVFRALGGFPEWKAFEDLEFSRRLARHGPTRLLTPPVISSARRFGDQPLRRTLRDLALTIQYLIKGAPHRSPTDS